jgi:uncharacterized protein with FMN-binding domain
MTTLTSKNAAVALAAFALLGTVAGCSSAADTASGTDTGTTTETETDSGTTTSGTYTDGTYDASASYQSPNGTESIDVEITLADNVITAVTVTGNGESPDSQRYQGEFENGIADVVVGKNIDEISVDKVAGSSLTSGGFNDAIEQIKSEATA